MTNGHQPIEDYGVIGDMHTVALVGKSGSIDFMSFPNFDSPTIFAAPLDGRRGASGLSATPVRRCSKRSTPANQPLPSFTASSHPARPTSTTPTS